MQITPHEIAETLSMVSEEHLDIRTITLGLNLRGCAAPTSSACARKVYDSMAAAERLVPTGEQIEREFGIPIVNKRISVTPIASRRQRARADLPPSPRRWTAPRKEMGVDFLGGFSALVHKGIRSRPRLIASIPQALAETELRVLVRERRLHARGHQHGRRGRRWAASSSAPPRPPPTASASARQAGGVLQRRGGQPLHGGRVPRLRRGRMRGHQRGRLRAGRGARRAGELPKDADLTTVAERSRQPPSRSRAHGRAGGARGQPPSGRAQGIVDLSLAPTPAEGDSVAEILEAMGLGSAAAPAPRRRSPCSTTP